MIKLSNPTQIQGLSQMLWGPHSYLLHYSSPGQDTQGLPLSPQGPVRQGVGSPPPRDTPRDGAGDMSEVCVLFYIVSKFCRLLNPENSQR